MMHDEPGGFFAFRRSFHLKSNGSLEQVVRSLKLLGDAGYTGLPNNDMLIVPDGDGKGYTFCHRVQHSMKGHLYTTAFSEGVVWPAQDGHVIVEGYTQIEPLRAYLAIGFYGFLACLLLPAIQGRYFFLPLFFIGAVAFYILRYSVSYKQARDGVAKAVSDTHNRPEDLRSETVTQTPYTEKAKNLRSSVTETTSHHSVWNETVSEYDAQLYNSKH